MFLALEGFDERYRIPSVEDIELGYRLTRAGYRIRLCKKLQVKHLKAWNVSSLLKTDFCARALPWTALIWKEGQMRNDLNLGVASRLSAIFVYALMAAGIGTFWLPSLVVISGVLVIALLISNAPLYVFYLQKSRS